VMPIALAKLPTIVPACISGDLYSTTLVKPDATPSREAQRFDGYSACAGRVLAHSITFRHREIPDMFPATLTNVPQSSRIERVLPKSGPVAQLGARFHGMEEVIGSIPIRSTNNPIRMNHFHTQTSSF
jgi:hypothetical protein